MLPYLLLFSFFALGALMTRPELKVATPEGHEGNVQRLHRLSPMLFVGCVLMVVMIGFRYEVGADWRAYEAYWKRADFMDLGDVWQMSDPAYHLLNWAARQLDLGIWAVNLACGAIFTWGLLRLAATQPRPWLVVVVAVPYLVTVVAMGYTRQAVAIGLLMGGLATVFRGESFLRFLFFAALAALFHKTAILVLPLVIFSVERTKFLSILGGLVFIYGLYVSLLAADVEVLIRNYIVAEYGSQGALIRVFLGLVPALLFFALRDRLAFDRVQERFWMLSSFAVVALLVALFAVSSSTAVDRMALYIIPLQLAVLARLPLVFQGLGVTAAVIVYSFIVQLVWLNFAAHAQWWVPYSITPL